LKFLGSILNPWQNLGHISTRLDGLYLVQVGVCTRTIEKIVDFEVFHKKFVKVQV